MAQTIKVTIKNNKTSEYFDDEFWPESNTLEEILEIFDEEYGNEEYTLARIDRKLKLP